MRIPLSMELCKKILEILPHERSFCTDDNRINQYPNSEGWVDCTRCWLLEAVRNEELPEVTFDLFASIKLPKKDTKALIEEYADLINCLGVNHPQSQKFFETYKHDREFLELARIAKQLKGHE